MSGNKWKKGEVNNRFPGFVQTCIDEQVMIIDFLGPCYIGQLYVIEFVCTFPIPKYLSYMLSFLGDKYCQIIVTQIGMRIQLGKNVLDTMSDKMPIMIRVQG